MSNEVVGPLKSLTVQSVLYRHSYQEVERMLLGVASAVQAIGRFNQIGPVRVLVGDCSPVATIRSDQLDSLRAICEPLGVGEILYDYFDANLGSAAGHNRLLALDTAPFVLFINPDTFASPFMLIELAQPHWDTSVGIAEARQIPLEHPKKFDHATGDTSWASTAGCLVRREVTEKLNGFDADSFFLYCDDVDFSWRTRLAGYRVLMQPTACLFHDKRLTAGGQIGVSEAEMYYSAEASLMLAWKYSRPDLARKWSEGLLQSENPTWVRAADRFEQRRAEGSLPRPIDADGRVAQFVGMQFAEHRFSYSD